MSKKCSSLSQFLTHKNFSIFCNAKKATFIDKSGTRFVKAISVAYKFHAIF